MFANPTPFSPTLIKVDKDRRSLAVTFDDGLLFEVPAELLRVLSPSSEVQGHCLDQRITVAGKKDVRIEHVEPIGNYAIQIVFDDGHNTGFYSWDQLHELGENRDAHWQTYLDDLARKGLSR